VLTFSRGAFIGLFVSLSIYLYFYYHKKNIKIKKPFFYSFVSVLLASFFIIIIFLGFNGVFHRFYGTLAERVLSFQEGVDYRVGVFCETIQNNEVLTLFGSKNSFDSEIFAGTYYLELLIRVGFIGLAVFLILSFIALKNFKKLRYSYPAVFCIIIFLIHCLVDVGHGILALFSLYLSLVSIDLRKPRP